MRKYQVLPLNYFISVFVIAVTLLLFASTVYYIFSTPFQLNHAVLSSQLISAINNTLIIGSATALISSFIGLLFAYVNVFYKYPLKKFLHLLAILPISIPVYIHAYNYNIMFAVNGSLSNIIGNLTNNQMFSLNVKNIWFTILIFSFSLYPYIYLMVRTALKQTNYALVESSQLLHKSHTRALLGTTYPIIRKVLFLSVILVLAETFSDIGVVDYFNINTISLLILRLYRIYNDFAAAILVGFFFSVSLITLFLIEKFCLKTYRANTSKTNSIKQVKMNPYFAILFYTVFIFVIGFAFIIPVLQMIHWTLISSTIFSIEYISVIRNTVYLVSLVVVVITITTVALSHVSRNNKFIYALSSILNFGYMFVSILISLVIIIFVQTVNQLFNTQFNVSLSLLFIVLALSLKFIPIMLNAVNKRYAQIAPQVIESSYVLNASSTKTFIKTEIPLIKTTIISSAVLIIIDVIKELTLTLTLRPFNFDTLSLRVSMFAKDERVIDSAVYSLTIVLIIAILVLFIYSKEESNAKN